MRKMDELHYKSNWSGGEGSGLEKVNALIVRMNRIYDAYENHLNQFHKQNQEPEMCNRCGFIHMKEEGCPKPTLKEPEMNGHWVIDQGGNKFWATDHKKEPECEHERKEIWNEAIESCVERYKVLRERNASQVEIAESISKLKK